MAITTAQVTVQSTAATLIVAASGSVGREVTIQNHGSIAVYLGASSTVTSTTGFRLPGVDGASVTLRPVMDVYGIAASSTQLVSVLAS